MPSISEILDSVSVPALIRDEVIRNGEFEKSNRGPIFYSGGFTVVFPVSTQHEKWAFRCWHTEMGNVRDRFKIISNYINNLSSSYFCDFYFYDNGIVVDGKLFPTTRMKWVNGRTINEYITKNCKNKDKLLSLAEKFLAMTEFLHEHHIAHGDLQHGNIIIENEDIKLVDYDSLFVPGLEKQSDIIIGKPEFQHPNRSKLKVASEKLDYFSELVIYLSIIAIAHAPKILDEFSIQDSLLFQASDWQDFENSKIFKALSKIKNDDITLLLLILKDYLNEESVGNLRPFSELWEDQLIQPVIKSFTCGNVDGIVFRNQKTEIKWEIENYKSISLNNLEVPSGKKNFLMKFSNDSEIVLCVKNGLHKIAQRKGIKVVDAPRIELNSNKKVLKKSEQGIETLILSWEVKDATAVSILYDGELISAAKSSSRFELNPSKDCDIELVAVGLDNKTEFRSKIEIVIREPAIVSFTSDKSFTLPDVPVTLSWNLTRAHNIQLNGLDIPSVGKTNVTPKTDEIYRLTYNDDFGEHSQTLEVKMLPLPVIETILVETPRISEKFDLQAPSLEITKLPSIPNIQLDFVRLVDISIPDLQHSGLFVELITNPQNNISTRISNLFKRIAKRINKKNKHGSREE